MNVSRIIMVCFAWTSALVAQEAAPKPPYIADKALAPSRWTIEYTYSSTASDARPSAPKLQQKRIVRSDITKSADVKLDRGFYEGGAVQDVWTTAGLMVLKDPAYAHKIVRRPSAGDFPELVWINNAQFKGRERIGEKECLVFQKDLYPLQFSDPGLFAAEMAQENRTLDLGNPVPVIAWIDANSKLPVKMKIGEDSRIYTFTSAPATPLTIPPEYSTAIAGVEEKFRAMVKPLAKP